MTPSIRSGCLMSCLYKKMTIKQVAYFWLVSILWRNAQKQWNQNRRKNTHNEAAGDADGNNF